MKRSVAVRAWFVVAMLVLVGCDTTAPIDHRGDPGVPAARTDASSAYDPANGTIVMFGGAVRSGVLAETWTWDGTVWRRQHPATTPSAREFAYMAFDPATSLLVMFGGLTCGAPDASTPTGCEYQKSAVALNDTWTWDGGNWSPIKTAHAPQPGPAAFREDGGMATDVAHKNVLLVTWPSVSGQSTVETWSLVRGDWRLLNPAHPPPASGFSGPAYDAVSRHVILQQPSGGAGGDAGRTRGAAAIGVRGNFTFWWDGADWNVSDQSVNTPHSYGRLVSVGSHGLLLIWIGSVYAWNGKSWSGYMQLPRAVSPSVRARDGWTAAYDEPTQKLILFGGREGAGGPDLRGDTASWDGSIWKIVVAAPVSPLGGLPQCDPGESIRGLGGSGATDPGGQVVEVDFGEPASGPCHLHVDVVASVLAGNELVNMPGNPATITVDFDLVPGGDNIGAVFDIHGVCALPQGMVVQFGGVGTIQDWTLVYSCGRGSPGQPAITTSLRHFRI